MGRQRKTDPDAALMAAVLLFWREGYHGVGTRQLEAETGITRFSLQTEHGGKRALFLTALDRYLDMFEPMLLAPLKDAGLDRLAAWFENRPLPEDMKTQQVFGCLMVNSITEFPMNDADIASRAQRFYDMLRTAFRACLDRALLDGDLPADTPIEHATEVLVNSAVGLNIAMKSDPSGARANRLGQATAWTINRWRNPR